MKVSKKGREKRGKEKKSEVAVVLKVRSNDGLCYLPETMRYPNGVKNISPASVSNQRQRNLVPRNAHEEYMSNIPPAPFV